MNIFYCRHLALFCTVFAIFSICGCFIEYDNKLKVIIVLSIVFVILILITVIFKKYRTKFLKSGICVLFAILSLFSQFIKIDTHLHNVETYFGEKVDVTAVVEKVTLSKNFLSIYSVKIEKINDISVNTMAILELEYNAELEAGDIIVGNLYINEIENYSDSVNYYKSQNIMLHLYQPDRLETVGIKKSLWNKFEEINCLLSDVITDQIDGDAGKFVSALTLGNKDLLDNNIVRDFRRAGISHVLAISGMHLSVFVFFLDYILKKLYTPKGIRSGIVVLIALFYLALTGFSLSTARAFIMTALIYLAYIFQADSDLLTNLFFSLFIILILSPASVYDTGLWLSFLAVVGIFVAQYFIKVFSDLLYSVYHRKKPKNNYALKLAKRKLYLLKKLIRVTISICSGILITFFATTFICLPSLLYFDEISLISIFTNLIVSPFVTLILYLVPIFLLTNFVQPIHNILGSIIEILSDFLLKLISTISSFRRITVSMNYSFAKPIIVTLAILLAICLVFKLKHKWIIFIPPIVASLIFASFVTFDTVFFQNIIQIDYIGETESEMLLLRDGNQYSIIDISTGATAYSNQAYKLSFKNCATEINSYVITHYHNYHSNSIQKVLKKAMVRTLYLPYPQSIDEYYIMSTLITKADAENVDIVIYDAFTDIQISNNTTLNLSQKYYLKRSTHPTFYFSLKSYDQIYTYFSESIFEVSEMQNEIFNLAIKSNFLLLGKHGPKTKSDIAIPNLSQNQTVIITNSEIDSFFNSSNKFKKLSGNITYFRTIITKIKQT